MARKIEMTFECDQDWEQMKVFGHGRHCELCRKTVYDFSDKSNDEIRRPGKDELCGMFLAEQIDADLTPIEVPRSLRTALLTIGTVLGLELNQVRAQELNQKQKTENVSGDLARTDTTTIIKTKPVDLKKEQEAEDCKRMNGPVRSRYYFSNRFPFIEKRRMRVMGRFRY